MKIAGKIKKLYKKAYKAMIEDCDLWQQLLNIAVVIAIVGGFISVILSLALKSSWFAISAFIFTCVFAIVCLIISLKSKDVIYAAVLFCIVAEFILFPYMYFTSGGFHGGMPIWLLLGLVISWVVIRKKILYVIYGLGLVFQCLCIIYSERHPKSIIEFPSEHAVAMDVVQSLALV